MSERYNPDSWHAKISAVKRCSIEGCSKPVSAKGWCSGHYRRWVSHRDPEGGKASHNEPLRWIKTVALEFDGDDCLIWPFAKLPDGRSALKFRGVSMSASRAVCFLVHGDPPSNEHHACHSCGMGHLACVNPSHLRWGSARQNTIEWRQHVSDGVSKPRDGEVLDVFSVIKIRTDDKDLSLSQLSKKYGISQAHASRVRRGQAWAWVDDDVIAVKNST